MNIDNLNATSWCENVIVVDADYVDRVAFNLIVNFERMIGRRIPQADMGQWLDCIALDGGVREGDNHTQVVLIHEKNSRKLDNFAPADYADELDGKAFTDRLGEFVIAAPPVEQMVSKDELMLDIVGTVCQRSEVRRIMVVPNAEEGTIYDDLRETLRRTADDNKRITLFAMQPMPGGNFRQEILGYSLMAALGIRGDEIKG